MNVMDLMAQQLSPKFKHDKIKQEVQTSSRMVDPDFRCFYGWEYDTIGKGKLETYQSTIEKRINGGAFNRKIQEQKCNQDQHQQFFIWYYSRTNARTIEAAIADGSFED